MTASVQSPADMVNLALSRSGRTERVGNLYDGSEFSKRALDLFAQGRDALLREADWGFPRGDGPLTLIKAAPPGGYNPVAPWNAAQNPPFPYFFEYAYPPDCLMLRAIRTPPLFIPDFAPLPQIFEIANDGVATPGSPTAPGRVILCNTWNAFATYVRQVTDMTQWDVGFVEAFADELARMLNAGKQKEGQQPQPFLGAVAPVHTVMRQG